MRHNHRDKVAAVVWHRGDNVQPQCIDGKYMVCFLNTCIWLVKALNLSVLRVSATRKEHRSSPAAGQRGASVTGPLLRPKFLWGGGARGLG